MIHKCKRRSRQNDNQDQKYAKKRRLLILSPSRLPIIMSKEKISFTLTINKKIATLKKLVETVLEGNKRCQRWNCDI